MPSDELVSEINDAIKSESQENEAGVESEGTEQTTEADGVTEQTPEVSEATEKTTEAGGAIEKTQETTAVDDSTANEPSGGGDVPQQATISDAILERALSVGISLADARQFPSEMALANVVESFERSMGVDELSEMPESEEEQTDPLDSLPSLDPEKYEPEVVDAFDAMKDVIRQQQETIQGIRDQQEQSQYVSQQAVGQELERWFDGQVADLGDDYKEALGDGGLRSLDQGSSQFAKRDAIANQMAVLHHGYGASGQSIPSRDELFSMAMKIVLGDEIQSIHEQKLSGELGKRARQHVSRSNSRKAQATQTPEEETAAMLDAKFGT